MTTQLRLPVIVLLALLVPWPVQAEWRPVPSRALRDGEIPVSEPGICREEGATYVLTQDVTAPTSALFLGKNVTLDLNGHTLTYAAGYSNVTNHSFEDGLRGWDTSKAPGAEAKAMPMQHPLVGDTICVLPEGQEIVSSTLELPVADRAYYAMVAVASHEPHLGIHVENENGDEVVCTFKWDNNVRPCCPEPERAAKLGGGVVFALVFGQPAGRYRIRIKAVRGTCVIDEVDIRPAMDVGVGIVERTMPWAYYKCILDGDGCAFFDYARRDSPFEPVPSIPKVTGEGTVRIRNGVIKLGCKAIRTWGVQSTARDVRVELENVKFEASGINTNAVNAPFASLRNCRAETDTPWIIDRHRQQDYVVSLLGGGASEVWNCELIGGQGQLAVTGDNSVIADNLLVNRQTVVNHYSIGVGGTGTRVFHNRIFPEQGSGILIGRQQGVEIFENDIRVAASRPVNEYHNTDYSVNAVRLTDYNATKESPKGWCGGNRIHHNRISITGRRFPGAHPNYKPMAYGIFMSVGGDQNFVYENTFVIKQLDPPNTEKHGAYAIYVGGSDQGGTYHHNDITSNVTPVWIGSMYGRAANVTIYANTFRKPAKAAPYIPFKLGWYKHPTRDVSFFSNRFEGLEFAVQIGDYTSGYTSEYDVGWTLTVVTAPGADVVVADAQGRQVATSQANDRGIAVLRLPQYHAAGRGQVVRDGRRVVQVEKTYVGIYTVKSAGTEKTITLTADMRVEL